MKNRSVVLLIIIFSSFNSFSQESFKLNRSGFNKVVFPVDSLKGSTDIIYKNIVEWIKRTYKNPDEVILSTIENEMIRFQGFTSNVACYISLGFKTCFDIKYTIQIDIKQNKIRGDIQEFSANNQAKHPNLNYYMWFKNNGDIRKVYSSCVDDSNEYFNNLFKSLLNFENNQKSDDDW